MKARRRQGRAAVDDIPQAIDAIRRRRKAIERAGLWCSVVGAFLFCVGGLVILVFAWGHR